MGNHIRSLVRPGRSEKEKATLRFDPARVAFELFVLVEGSLRRGQYGYADNNAYNQNGNDAAAQLLVVPGVGCRCHLFQLRGRVRKMQALAGIKSLYVGILRAGGAARLPESLPSPSFVLAVVPLHCRRSTPLKM